MECGNRLTKIDKWIGDKLHTVYDVQSTQLNDNFTEIKHMMYQLS